MIVTGVNHASIKLSVTKFLGDIASRVAFIMLIAAVMKSKFRNKRGCGSSTTSISW